MKSLFEELYNEDDNFEDNPNLDNDKDDLTDEGLKDEKEEDDPQEEVEEEQEENQEEDNPEDDTVQAFYDYLRDNDLIDEIEGFKGDPTQLQEHLNKLPEVYLNKALSVLHKDGAELFNYVVALGEKADRTELKKFFDTYIDQETDVDLSDEDEAYKFLEERLGKKKEFKDPAKLAFYLDSLVEDGTISDLAKEINDDEKEEREKGKQAIVEAQKAQQLADQEAQKEFTQNIIAELDSYKWKREKKEEIVRNLDQREASRKNALIAKSPKALIQLADIYSKFNEKTGEFDFSDFETKAKSKQAVQQKEELDRSKVTSYINKSVKRKENEAKEGFFNQFDRVE